MYQGRNDRKWNYNKYNPPKLATAGKQVLPSGAIIIRKIEIKK